MGKARVKLPFPEPVRREAILIVDSRPPMQESVRARVSADFGERCEIGVVSNGDDALVSLRSLRDDKHVDVRTIAVDLALEFDVGSPELAQLITRMREEVPESTSIIAYTDRPLDEVWGQALKAGASTCVQVDDVVPAVHGVFLESEFAGLGKPAPYTESVLNRIDVGISIQNVQMDVLWANARTECVVAQAEKDQRTCWKRYHKFYHRQCACPNCTGWRVLQDAVAQSANGRPISNGVLTDCHVLPIEGRIGRIEINAAPLPTQDGCKLLAVIEASRYLTKEWEQDTPADARLREVVDYARLLGQENDKTRPFAAVAVYYRPEPDEDLHLFYAAAEDGEPIPKVLRLTDCATEYRDVLVDGQPRFFSDQGGSQRRHFLWQGRTPHKDTDVLIDVVYAGDKPGELCTHDLRPYWQYVIDEFNDATATREDAFKQTSDSILEEFLAPTGSGIRDDASLDHVLQIALNCVQKALRPLSMYVRILDRSSSTLVKQAGSGAYYQIAPKNRALRFEGIGSGGVASSRNGCLAKRADINEMRRCLGRSLSADEEGLLKRIVSYVTVPLTCMDRVLGTLSIQFDDDSLFSHANCRFIEAIAVALGRTLGNLEWAQERAAMVKCLGDLDNTMFQRSEQPEEERVKVLARVTGMAFELTSAEVVVYYRYDPTSETLNLVPSTMQGTLPDNVALPEVVPRGVGVLSLAVGKKRTYRVRNYRTGEWRGIRDGIFAAFRKATEQRFCEWIGSEIAAPVIARNTVRGVLVALSSIPGWLGSDDEKVVEEFAYKTGVWLAGKELMHRLNWRLNAEISLNDVTAAMARISDVDTMHRLFLLAVTTKECLGFSRAILFQRQLGERHKFTVAEAVGARSYADAQARWGEANQIAFEDKVKACDESPPIRPGDLCALLGQLVLDLQQHPKMHHAFQQGQAVVHRREEPHVIHNSQLWTTLCPEDKENWEYVLAPLITGGDVTGAVFADRAFLDPTEISSERLELLQLLSGEFSLMLKAIKLRREEEEARVTKELARGVGYSLRTGAAVLAGRLANLAYDLGEEHGDEIDGLKRAVEFFGRGGTLASKIRRIAEIGPGTGERFDLSTLLTEMVDVLDDPRITLKHADAPVFIQAERDFIKDAFQEIVRNACEFTDGKTGKIKIAICADDKMVEIDCEDNGSGIPPAFKPDLFKPFKCHPASRMGLGLSYAQLLIKSYEGTIAEIGKFGEGAHFVVQIPLAKEENNGTD